MPLPRPCHRRCGHSSMAASWCTPRGTLDLEGAAAFAYFIALFTPLHTHIHALWHQQVGVLVLHLAQGGRIAVLGVQLSEHAGWRQRPEMGLEY